MKRESSSVSLKANRLLCDSNHLLLIVSYCMCWKKNSMVAGLALYWQFAEFKENTVFDSSGHDNNGIVQTGGALSKLRLVPGVPICDEDEWGEKVEPGRSLHGTVICDEIEGIANVFSIEFHARRTQSNRKDWAQLLCFGDILRLSIKLDSGTCVVSIGSEEYQTTKRVLLNQWTHFALICEAQTLTFAIDGQEFLSNIPLPELSSRRFKVGDVMGDVTEVRVWSIPRSIPQIKQYMQSPLPRSAAVSKWKGLKIKEATVDNSGKTFSVQPVGQPKSRRDLTLTDMNTKPESTPLSVAKPAMIIKPEFVASDAKPDIIIKPESKPTSVAKMKPDSTSVAKPDVTQPVVRVSSRVSESGSISSRAGVGPSHVPWLQATPTVVQHPGLNGDTTACTSPEPIVPSESFLPVTSPLPEIVVSRPVLHQLANPDYFVPKTLSEAISQFDTYLEYLVLVPCFEKAQRLIKCITQFIQQNYRIGPYLSPYPEKSIMSRLEIACKYMAVASILRNTRNPLNLILRIPILKQDVIKFTLSAIDDAVKRKDQVSVKFFSNSLLKTCSSDISGSEIERIRGIAESADSFQITNQICCPLCHYPFETPLQDYCLNGCRVRFVVCYLTGSLIDACDCVKCVFCQSNIGLKTSRKNAIGISVTPTPDPDMMCPICKCTGSLVRA